LKFSSYERSDEYKERYEKPLEVAIRSAWKEVGELDVMTSDGDTRKGTPDDFNALINMPTGAATTAAKEIFGEAASEVLALRRQIRGLNEARATAVEDYRTKGAERDKDRTAQSFRQRERMSKLWASANDEAAKKYPDLFAPEEGDENGNKLLKRGYEIADLAFSGFGKLPPEEMVKLHSAVRNKAAGFDRAVYRARKLSDRVKELESELAEYKKSEPTPGEGARTTPTRTKTFEEEIDDLATQS
jgi:hypothetical protein